MKRELLRAAAGMAVFVVLIGILVVRRQLSPPEPVMPVPDEYLGDVILPPRKAPAFDLMDRSGQRLTLTDLKNRVVVLGFAYTNCATICPLTFQSMLGVERALDDEKAKQVALVLITLDPILDSPERLEEATRYVGGHWYFLTEEQPILEEVWKAYRVFRERNQGVVDHTGLTYLIDRQGLMRVRYGGTTESKVLLNDIERLLEVG